MLTKIAVFVSGGGTNLQALMDAETKGIIHSGTISLVVSSQADAYALERAKQKNIPTAVVCRSDYSSQKAFEDALKEKLSAFGIQMIVFAGYLEILSEGFTSAYPKRIINVHPSLIPSFCGEGFYGLHVHEAALEKGVKVTGATVHYVNEITDGGEIILQKAVKVHEGDTPSRLQKRVMRQAEWKILPEAAEIVSERIAKGN